MNGAQEASERSVRWRSQLAPEERLCLLLARGTFPPATRARALDLLDTPLRWDVVLDRAATHAIFPLLHRNLERLEFHRVPPAARDRLAGMTQLLVAWTVEVRGPSGALKARFTQSTPRGMLLAREDLERTRPGFVPTLSPWGEARLSILSLCDGQRSVADIEREVYRRHPTILPSFVAEVITRYSASGFTAGHYPAARPGWPSGAGAATTCSASLPGLISSSTPAAARSAAIPSPMSRR